jgi:hypothetical protein
LIRQESRIDPRRIIGREKVCGLKMGHSLRDATKGTRPQHDPSQTANHMVLLDWGQIAANRPCHQS